jgi:hypothetical protein
LKSKLKFLAQSETRVDIFGGNLKMKSMSNSLQVLKSKPESPVQLEIKIRILSSTFRAPGGSYISCPLRSPDGERFAELLNEPYSYWSGDIWQFLDVLKFLFQTLDLSGVSER